MMHKEKLSERIHIGVPIPRPYPARASFHSSGPMDDPPEPCFSILVYPGITYYLRSISAGIGEWFFFFNVLLRNSPQFSKIGIWIFSLFFNFNFGCHCLNSNGMLAMCQGSTF